MIRRLGLLFRSLFQRRRLEQDLDEELRSSFDMIVERFIARGVQPEEARRAARIEFEGLDAVKEKVRDGFTGASLFTCVQDVRYAWRGLWRRPSFALVAVVTLALGVGVNTAVFSVFYSVLLRPLAYEEPEQLVLVWASFRSAGTARAPVSGAILGEIGHRNRSLAGVAGIWTLTRTFAGDDPEQVKFARVTPNFFDLLGVRAAQGHTFQGDEAGGAAVLLTDGIFRRRFASDRALIGQALRIQGRPTTLTGVLPADFRLHFAPDANVPADVQGFDLFEKGIYASRDQYYIRVVGRLKPGVSKPEAQRDLDRVAAEIRSAYTQYEADDLRFTVAGMQSDSVREVQPAVTALFAGAGFVLLICCVNVSSLLMARASDRRREITLRLAVGASRGRVLRQLIIEGGVLCAIGGAAGIAVGWAGFHALLAIRPERFAYVGDPGLSWPVLAFTAATCAAATILFALVPAVESFRLDLIASLRAGGRGWLGRMHRRAGGVLVVGEIALAFILVTGAALAARTLGKIERVNPGFESHGVLSFQVAGIPMKQVRDWEAQLRAMPGVRTAGAISHLPLDKDLPNWYGPYRPEGARHSEALVSDLRCVTPDYFAAIGARLIEGRFFNADDRADGQPVAIVDDLLARSTWPGESAIGKRIEAEHVTDRGFVPVWTVVVGVVEHIHNHSLTQQVRGQIYMPFEQSARSPLTFVLRTDVAPLSLVPAIRTKLHERSKNAAMAKVRPMEEYIAREISPASFTAVLAGISGGLALLLAATGIYGVLNYHISRRMPEMGVRMALGASRCDVLGLVLREAGTLAAIGVALGTAGALIAGRWLVALIYGVSPRDALSYALAFVLLPSAAILGCWRPAARAASADPAEVVREQ
ncbi:MAG: ABC transporter permease [Acidobacteriia bacterium]|nr:ABC transporter permease [Terriglobia bacterium]